MYWKENNNVMNKPILIGIAGGSASGKTSIARKIKDTFSDTKSVLIVRQDEIGRASCRERV